MKQISGSIYFHLTLVLLIALGASFATMYILFLSHLEETRNNHLAHSLIAQVRLAEAILATRPAADFPAIDGIHVTLTTPKPVTSLDSDGVHRLFFLKHKLDRALNRDVSIIPATRPVAGLWVKLNAPTEQPWAFIPTPNRRTSSEAALEHAMIVGFAVFFVGGMGLLWRIQRPLKRLGTALEKVGHYHPLTELPVSGAGEIRMLTERYNEMVDRLHHYEEERATMLAGVAHDLRTPITRLRLLMELVQSPRSGEMLRNLNDIGHITEQFLDYARGRNDEAIIQTDLTTFAEEIAAPYAEQGVVCINSQESIVAEVRENSLRRALVNLIENAIEYGRPPIVVRTSRNDTHISLSVEDCGDGIASDQVERAMRPFSRLDPSRSGEGHCGLGLVITAKIADEHQGKLELGNGPSGGLIATIELPPQ